MSPARLMISLFVLAALPLASRGAVEGRVGIDSNGNGRVDPGEPPVEGCLVSDGRQLVRTDAQGRYALAAEAPDDVFVINPAGTWPSGAWWAAVDAEAARQIADFALKEQSQPGPLVFVQGTDPHLRPEAVDLYRQYLDHVNRLPLPVRFVVHTGDMVVDALRLEAPAAEKLFQLYEEQTRALRFPLRELIGNHEHVGLALKEHHPPRPPYGKAMYQARLGPTSYAFRWGAYHFLALDGSTIDAGGKTGYRDCLDRDSAAWACRYLETVGPGEPVVVLCHQPRSDRDTDQMLLAALEGKRLVLVLCGHGHGRVQAVWGGAPMIMGGAVSYAWHGLLPYPADPWGYVVYRLEGLQIEHAYVDWAAERSFDLASPAWGSLASAGRLDVEGTVTDFDSSLRRVVCSLAGRRAEARLEREGHLVQRFEATIDTIGLSQGVYDLVIEASDGHRQVKHTRPLVLAEGREEAVSGFKAAKLRFFAEGPGRAEAQILWNDRPLPRLDAAKHPGAEVVVELRREPLQRLNRLTVTPARGRAIQLRDVRLEVDGRRARDVRFSPASKRPRHPQPSGNGALDYYIDVTYRGPRGS